MLSSASLNASEARSALTAETSDDCERCFGNLIPFWVVAVIVSCMSSLLTVGGFVLQKMALRDQEVGKRWPSIGDIVFSPKWLLGFFLAIVLPLPGDLLAYALAPMSLLAPLSGFTVLVNFVIAPSLLGERRQLIPDVSASLLILVGMVLTTCTGDHGENTSSMSIRRMVELAAERIFLIAISALASVICLGLIYMYFFRRSIQVAAMARPANPPMHELMLPALMYAGFGCLTNISLKAVSELIAAGRSFAIVASCAVFVVAPFACLQLSFLNRGLRLYLQVVFFPVASALLLITNTCFGAIYYQEYKVFADSPGQLVIFVCGIVSIVIGINVFQTRRHESVCIDDAPGVAHELGHDQECQEQVETPSAVVGVQSKL